MIGNPRYVVPFDIKRASYDECNDLFSIYPKRCGLLGGVLFGKMKFVLSNFLSNENLSISFES